jgi:hypothetical protein
LGQKLMKQRMLEALYRKALGLLPQPMTLEIAFRTA